MTDRYMAVVEKKSKGWEFEVMEEIGDVPPTKSQLRRQREWTIRCKQRASSAKST